MWGVADFTSVTSVSPWLRDCASLLGGDFVRVGRGFTGDSASSASPDESCVSGVSCGQTTATSPHLLIVADAELHNRDELLRQLGCDDKNPADTSDSNLILRAYEKWAEGCPEYLLGDFAFAVWDDARKRLFCCRDHMGSKTFLYWKDGSKFVFAGYSGLILACPGVPRRLNRRKLAAATLPAGFHYHREETFHAGILSLPSGCSMTVDRDEVKTRRYWEPVVDERLVPRKPAESLEALRAILVQAVEDRLHPSRPVSVQLSGGLDSSAIASIAARSLEKQNRQLNAISAVLPETRLGQFSDERGFIDEFRSWPNIQIRYVTGGDRGPFDSLHDPRPFEVFPLRPSRFYLVEECEKVAIANGSQSLLWGVGAEMGPSAPGDRYYLELALNLRLPTLLKEWHDLRAAGGQSLLRKLKGQVTQVLFPLRRQAALTVLSREFQRECEAKRPPAVRLFSERQLQIYNVQTYLNKHAVGKGQGITLIRQSAPFLDKRIVEFCLALPSDLRVHGGYSRYPIRGALEGILPPRIQWRTTKTPFAPDYFLRYNSQLGMARDFVDAIGPRDPVRTVVDVDLLRSLMVPVDPLRGNQIARFQVPMGCFVITFLRQFSEFSA